MPEQVQKVRSKATRRSVPAKPGKTQSQPGPKKPVAKAGGVNQARPVIEEIVATKLMRDEVKKEKFYLQSKISLALSGCLALSTIANVILFMQPSEVKYFATDPNGKIMKLVSLNQPVQSVNEVLSWATSSITKSYTFSFANWRQELQSSRDFFTPKGWEGFQEALQESGNLKSVIENKFVTTAVPRGAPVVVGEGYIDGRYAWKIEVPILVTYQSANKRTTQSLLVEAVLVRRSELEHPKGIGIAQIIAQ